MVLAPVQQQTSHRVAATTAASLHLYHDGAVVETPLARFADAPDLEGVAVIVPGRGLVEWFPHDAQDLDDLAGVVPGAVAAGWRVVVLVPAPRMGEAHRALRGTGATLQPWWPDDEAVRFGGPEVP